MFPVGETHATLSDFLLAMVPTFAIMGSAFAYAIKKIVDRHEIAVESMVDRAKDEVKEEIQNGITDRLDNISTATGAEPITHSASPDVEKLEGNSGYTAPGTDQG